MKQQALELLAGAGLLVILPMAVRNAARVQILDA
jgi:hypothetical protein